MSLSLFIFLTIIINMPFYNWFSRWSNPSWDIVVLRCRWSKIPHYYRKLCSLFLCLSVHLSHICLSNFCPSCSAFAYATFVQWSTGFFFKRIHRAGQKDLKNEESMFNSILTSQSYDQLLAVFDAYHKISGRDIEYVIKSEMTGDQEKGLLTIGKWPLTVSKISLSHQLLISVRLLNLFHDFGSILYFNFQMINFPFSSSDIPLLLIEFYFWIYTVRQGMLQIWWQVSYSFMVR